MSVYNFTWKIHQIDPQKKNIIRVFLLFLLYTSYFILFLSCFICLTLLLVELKFKQIELYFRTVLKIILIFIIL